MSQFRARDRGGMTDVTSAVFSDQHDEFHLLGKETLRDWLLPEWRGLTGTAVS